jgi:membrane-bound metal-dependent hydrolase YbcI (DUF457 family)
MLIAHVVPAYFALAVSKPKWKPEWPENRRALLVLAAYVSAVWPDADAIYNTLFREMYFRHSILWTHSLIPHLCICLVWLLLRCYKRLPYLQTLVGLVEFGGLSHLALDVIAHGTPLHYPFSMFMFRIPYMSATQGGIWAYLSSPVCLFEPIMFALVARHWILQRNFSISPTAVL